MKGVFKSTPAAFEDFEKSIIWSDFVTEIEGAIELHRNELERVDDYVSMIRLQETINAIRHLLEMPRVIREKISDGYEETQKEPKKERKE
jgi:hypothetical protein